MDQLTRLFLAARRTAVLPPSRATSLVPQANLHLCANPHRRIRVMILCIPFLSQQRLHALIRRKASSSLETNLSPTNPQYQCPRFLFRLLMLANCVSTRKEPTSTRTMIWTRRTGILMIVRNSALTIQSIGASSAHTQRPSHRSPCPSITGAPAIAHINQPSFASFPDLTYVTQLSSSLPSLDGYLGNTSTPTSSLIIDKGGSAPVLPTLQHKKPLLHLTAESAQRERAKLIESCNKMPMSLKDSAKAKQSCHNAHRSQTLASPRHPLIRSY
ncbi:hypothetical protein BC936DRAFT_139266 [Jimgerdemannia flammicorona]|uniref:Uncharacterized protein n=1 Tax=Jimgerdemannia flammicorona TaxID=994334 RepID=A0A433BA94_9FUNG|nr:hypothetical protein BC936DRAFT_139266 [Jimgerdemannia flammicorona]